MNTVEKEVAHYFHELDYNCARTVLLILARHFSITLDKQIFAAATGMHGAGGYRAQCGLVEGTLMFIGLLGAERKVDEEAVISSCHDFGQAYENEFSSLLCSTLRPGGFNNDDPPHLCEPLTCKSTLFAIQFLKKTIQIWNT